MEVRFVNRIEEIRILKNWCEKFRYVPLYIYGPEGCGKTRLLKEFVKKFDEFFGEDSVAIYIDAMEDRDIKRALATSKNLVKIVDLVKICIEVVKDLLEAGIPLGQALSRSISLIIDKIVTSFLERKLENKHLFVVIDDVARVIGIDKIEWYVKWLFETMNKLNEEYKPKAINFVVTTSEGISRKIIAKHRHAEIVLLWNLNKKAFKELFYELNPPSNISFEDIWLLLGGNPGKLMELANRYDWNVDLMLNFYTHKLREVVRRIRGLGLLKELKLYVEDITKAERSYDEKILKLEEILEEHNLIIYKRWILLSKNWKSFDETISELGIGYDYAWQVPFYKDVINQVLKGFKGF